MSSQLSKLHIRFIQTQKQFFLSGTQQNKERALPLKQLYIKNSGSFYFTNLDEPIAEGQTLTLLFKEANDYLKSLRCTVAAHEVQKSGEEFEDALLFFQIEPDAVRQLLLLSVDTLSDE